MTTPWVTPTIRPLSAAQDAQSGNVGLVFEDNVSNPSGNVF